MQLLDQGAPMELYPRQHYVKKYYQPHLLRNLQSRHSRYIHTQRKMSLLHLKQWICMCIVHVLQTESNNLVTLLNWLIENQDVIKLLSEKYILV